MDEAAALIKPGLIHASAVAWQKQGVLILGPSGSGKSALALELMAYGAILISDDCTDLALRDGRPWLSAPERLRGQIEARGVGILAATPGAGAWLTLVADLSVDERDRLPPRRSRQVLGSAVPCVQRVASAHFAPAILQYLKGGRSA